MVDYGKGKIYKIVNDVNNDIYIGSTCKTLAERMGNHRTRTGKRTSKISQSMAQIGKEHFRIILIENFPTDSKDKLNAREDYYIQLMKPSLNTNGAVFNIEKSKETQMKYREEHKEQIKELNNKYREEHKQENKKYREEKKQERSEYAKKYYEENKQKILERHKKHYEGNKQELKEYAKEYREEHKQGH